MSSLGAGLTCTTGMCANAKVQLAVMQDTYKQHADDPNFADKYKPSVDTLQAEFDASYSIWSMFIPWNPECCKVQDIGNQAEALTNQMLAYVGVQLPNVPQSFDWTTLAIIGAVLFVAAPYVTPFLRGRK